MDNRILFQAACIKYKIKEAVLFIVHVFIQVKKNRIEDFKNVTLDNARNSMNEPGIARFDVTQQQDDFSQFVLVEVYRTPDDPAKHKETVHYKKWRDAVADMLVRDRHRILYSNVFPDENGWG